MQYYITGINLRNDQDVHPSESPDLENKLPIEQEYVPTAEEFLPRPRKKKHNFQRWPNKRFLITPFIFAFFCTILTLIYIHSFEDYLSASAYTVFKKGEYWRILSALFVHADIVHLGFNLLPLIFFGWLMRAYFGLILFPIISLLIGIISNIITIINYEPRVSLIGASGMLYGMFALWLVFYIKNERERILWKKLLRVVGFTLLILFPQSYEPQVSYLAHASGFGCGLIAGLCLVPFVRIKDNNKAN